MEDSSAFSIPDIEPPKRYVLQQGGAAAKGLQPMKYRGTCPHTFWDCQELKSVTVIYPVGFNYGVDGPMIGGQSYASYPDPAPKPPASTADPAPKPPASTANSEPSTTQTSTAPKK
jgi:hypothetical protein